MQSTGYYSSNNSPYMVQQQQQQQQQASSLPPLHHQHHQQQQQSLNPVIMEQQDGLLDDEDEEDEEGEGGNEKKPAARRSGRRKIKIEYIEDKTRRHITFSKRKAGIMKKAYELSTLTGTQVLLLVVSETGLVYTFTTPKLQPLVTKPEGKNLIQSCLNAPDNTNMIESSSSNNNNSSAAAVMASASASSPSMGNLYQK